MRIRRSILLAALAAAAAGALAAAGCQPAYRPMPYMPKPLTAPQPLACHDAIGHITSNKPWVLGGTCCCTPTAANFAIHRNNGTVDKSMTYEAYLALFKEKGVVTDLDHKGCGNVCTSGPHVLLGGKCMATPAPGTWMYERITYGPHTPLTADDAKAGHAPAAPMTPYGPYGPRAGMM
ncbi:MAG: hypothetical protein FJ288_02350 [Planctomycetes bacterium]|nr:hypothetical protein [Planctomycetota bacterium]